MASARLTKAELLKQAKYLDAQLAEELENGHEVHGLLADICDLAFRDDMRAANHAYEGIKERVRELLKKEEKLDALTKRKPRTPIRKVNPKRRKASYERNYGDRGEAIREMPCVARTDQCKGSIQATHVQARGMGGRNGDRRSLVPLCDWHHKQQHWLGACRFEKNYRVDLHAEATRIAEELDRRGYK